MQRNRTRRSWPPPSRYTCVRRALRDSRTLPTLDEIQSLLIDEVLFRFPTQSEQAAALGIHRESLNRKLRRVNYPSR